MDDELSLPDAARLRDVTPGRMYAWIQRGMPHVKRKGRIFVKRSDALAFEPAPQGWVRGRKRARALTPAKLERARKLIEKKTYREVAESLGVPLVTLWTALNERKEA